MFTCGNRQLPPHQHHTVIEARRCYGLHASEAGQVPHADQPGTMTRPQEAYLRSLGATSRQLRTAHNVRISKTRASQLIDTMKVGDSKMERRSGASDAQQRMAATLFPDIPKGYYAVQADENFPLTFLRVAHPSKGQYKGATTVQSQHGPNLNMGVVVYPTGRVSVIRQAVLQDTLFIVSDPVDAAIRYAREIGNCCRCNASLTDARSRHYGIGPECEKYWPDVIERVDEQEELEQSK